MSERSSRDPVNDPPQRTRCLTHDNQPLRSVDADREAAMLGATLQSDEEQQGAKRLCVRLVHTIAYIEAHGTQSGMPQYLQVAG